MNEHIHKHNGVKETRIHIAWFHLHKVQKHKTNLWCWRWKRVCLWGWRMEGAWGKILEAPVTFCPDLDQCCCVWETLWAAWLPWAHTSVYSMSPRVFLKPVVSTENWQDGVASVSMVPTHPGCAKPSDITKTELPVTPWGLSRDLWLEGVSFLDFQDDRPAVLSLKTTIVLLLGPCCHLGLKAMLPLSLALGDRGHCLALPDLRRSSTTSFTEGLPVAISEGGQRIFPAQFCSVWGGVAVILIPFFSFRPQTHEPNRAR